MAKDYVRRVNVSEIHSDINLSTRVQYAVSFVSEPFHESAKVIECPWTALISFVEDFANYRRLLYCSFKKAAKALQDTPLVSFHVNLE